MIALLALGGLAGTQVGRLSRYPLLIVNRTPSETLADLVSGGLQLDPQELNAMLRNSWLAADARAAVPL